MILLTKMDFSLPLSMISFFQFLLASSSFTIFLGREVEVQCPQWQHVLLLPQRRLRIGLCRLKSCSSVLCRESLLLGSEKSHPRSDRVQGCQQFLSLVCWHEGTKPIITITFILNNNLVLIIYILYIKKSEMLTECMEYYKEYLDNIC